MFCSPSDMPFNELPQQFCQFFADKIKKLREELDSHQCEPPSFAVFEGPVFNHFSIIPEDEICTLNTKMPTKGFIIPFSKPEASIKGAAHHGLYRTYTHSLTLYGVILGQWLREGCVAFA